MVSPTTAAIMNFNTIFREMNFVDQLFALHLFNPTSFVNPFVTMYNERRFIYYDWISTDDQLKSTKLWIIAESVFM